MPPQQMYPQQVHPQQIQAQLQNPAQAMYQDRHYFPEQTSSRREHLTNDITHGRDENPKHKHRHRKHSRQASSHQGSENGAQSEVGGYAPSQGTAHSSIPLRRFLGNTPNHPRGIPSPPSSIYSSSDDWSDSGRSEGSATTVRAYAAPDRRCPDISGDLSRAYRRDRSLSSATTSSIAPSSDYGGDDERSESEYTSRAPDHIAHNSSSAESEYECRNWVNWVVGQFEVMGTFLSKMQSDVEGMKHDFITNQGASPLNDTCCQGIRFQLDNIREPLGVIERVLTACREFNQEFPRGQTYGTEVRWAQDNLPKVAYSKDWRSAQ